MQQTIVLEGGYPWGFRIDGGCDLRQPLAVSKVISGSKAYNHGLLPGDTVERINGEEADLFTNAKAKHHIRTAGQRLVLQVRRVSNLLTIPKIRKAKAEDAKTKKVTFSEGKRREADDIMLISASGSPLGRDKETSSVSMANGNDKVVNSEQSTSANLVWSPYGKCSVGSPKAYKPVMFSLLSSTSSPLSSSDSSVKSSFTWSSSASSVPRPSDVTASAENGFIVSEACASVPGEEKPPRTERKLSGREGNPGIKSVTTNTSVIISSLAVDNKPQISSTTYNLKAKNPSSSSADIWKPPASSTSAATSAASTVSSDAGLTSSTSTVTLKLKPSASAAVWKPPASSSFDQKRPVPSTQDSHPTVSVLSSRKIPPENKTLAVTSSGSKPPVSVPPWKPPANKPPVSSDAKSKPSSLPVPWKMPNDDSEVRTGGDSAKPVASSHVVSKGEPIDTTIFDEELTEDWWNNLFNYYQKAEAAEAAAVVAAVDGGDDKISAALNSSPKPLSNTAAALHLSSSLGDAIQNALEADRVESKQKQAALSPKMNRGPQKPLKNEILEEWRSGFQSDSRSIDSTIQKDYDHLKEIHESKRQLESQKTRDSQPLTGNTDDQGLDAETEPSDDWKMIEEKAKLAKDSKMFPIPVKFEGIGPMDEKTGVPIATRVSIDEKNRKDWYRHMYASLHKPATPPSSGRLRVNSEPKDARSPTPPDVNHPSYYPPHAKYKSRRYRNQPLRIEDYEPGYHSSTALLDNDASRNRSFESDAEVDYRNGDVDLVTRELLNYLKDDGKDRSGTRRKTLSSNARAKSCNRRTARQIRDEENQRRKEEVETVVVEERRRRFAEEQKQNEARRHRDLLTPIQKKTFLHNRFNEYEVGGRAVEHPKQVKAVKLRGKGKALYSFKAQNNTELSFKKGDIIYLLRQVDKNWFQGEHNGIVGIFPIAYVEVITSLEEAKTMALQREGKAVAKFDFKPKTSAELELRKGDVVMLIRKVDQNWYEGRIGNRQGIFPVGFVETIQEPDTPLMTPSPSQAPTPLPDACGPLSPTSSVCSGGPEVPSAPVSPWNSDFYDSEFEPEINSRILTRPRSGRMSDILQQKSQSLGRKSATSSNSKSGTYFTLPARTKASEALSSSSGKPDRDLRNVMEEKDLFALASRRRANAGNLLETRSASLGDDLEKIMSPATHSSLEKSLSFDFGQKTNLSKDITSSYPRYSVLYDYKPKNVDELKLKEGDVVCVMEKCDDGWYVGFSETTDEFGTFPGNYVQLVS